MRIFRYVNTGRKITENVNTPKYAELSLNHREFVTVGVQNVFLCNTLTSCSVCLLSWVKHVKWRFDQKLNEHFAFKYLKLNYKYTKQM